MNAEDSANLIDTPAASKLGAYRALLYSEEEGRLEKFRPYGVPSEEWLGWVGERFRERLTQRLPADDEAPFISASVSPVISRAPRSRVK